jgi:hypothetical protein
MVVVGLVEGAKVPEGLVAVMVAQGLVVVVMVAVIVAQGLVAVVMVAVKGVGAREE